MQPLGACHFQTVLFLFHGVKCLSVIFQQCCSRSPRHLRMKFSALNREQIPKECISKSLLISLIRWEMPRHDSYCVVSFLVLLSTRAT